MLEKHKVMQCIYDILEADGWCHLAEMDMTTSAQGKFFELLPIFNFFKDSHIKTETQSIYVLHKELSDACCTR